MPRHAAALDSVTSSDFDRDGEDPGLHGLYARLSFQSAPARRTARAAKKTGLLARCNGPQSRLVPARRSTSAADRAITKQPNKVRCSA